MNKLTTLIGASIALLTLSAPALAHTPQPEPAGKIIILHMPAHAALRAAALRNAADFDDGNYCGTKVPGLPHAGGGIIHGGGRFSDADDNYCGTRVPGRGPVVGRFDAARVNSHQDVMLNPQPLPPHDGGAVGRMGY